MKISGSQYIPSRLVTEIALGITPLKLQVDEIILKFMIKNFNDPLFKGIFLQLEETRNHPFHSHVRQIKKYIQWKRSRDIIELTEDVNNNVANTNIISLLDIYLQKKWKFVPDK